MLVWSDANAKTKKLKKVPELQRWLTGRRKIVSLDLLSGYSCPFAKDCLAKVQLLDSKGKSVKFWDKIINWKTHKLKLADGPFTQFRCFSASQEVLFKHVFEKRKQNFESLKGLSVTDIFRELSLTMPAKAGIIRLHVAGDFFNQAYFDAWLQLAAHNPDKLFYAYTKSLNFWLNRVDDIPSNFVLTASRGGMLDNKIDEHGLREAKVVFSVDQALDLGLEIDDNDSHAAVPEWRDNSFALLIHGVQPKGSLASKALSLLKGK